MTQIYFLIADLFNPSPFDLGCFYAVYPYDCFLNEEIECIRGSVGAMHIAIAAVMGIMLVSLLSVITCMAIIIVGACRNNVNVETINNNNNSRYHHHRSNRNQHNRRTKPPLFTTEILNNLLVKQAILYMSAFLLTWIFPIINNAMQKHIVFSVLAFIFWPLQGFFNALIFIYNKVYNIKRHDESVTTCEALEYIFIKPGEMPEIYLSDVKRVEADFRRSEIKRDEVLARTDNYQNNDDSGSNDVAFPVSIREEVSLIFDDISSLMNRRRAGDNVADHVALSLQDDQNRSVVSLSGFDEVCESNDEGLKIRDDYSNANFSVEDNHPISLREDLHSKDDTLSSTFKQVSSSNPNLSLDS